MSKDRQWKITTPLTLALGLIWLAATPTPSPGQSAGGKPPVEVDNSVLEQLGPPTNLPEMLLQATPPAPAQKIVLIPPKPRKGAPGDHKLTAPPLAEPPGMVHLHPIKPHAKAEKAEDRPAAGERPAPEAKPARKTAIAKATGSAAAPAAAEPAGLTPTLATPAGATPPPPPVTAEPLKAANARSKAPPAETPPAAAAPAPVAAPPAAPPAVPTATAPAANGAPQPLVALTAQPPGAAETQAAAPAQESLSTIRFDKESARLPDDARDVLAHLASRMSEDATLEVQLLAYAAGDEENASKARRLSLSRALAVRSFLIDQGVRSTRIEVRALGNKVPDGAPDRVDIAVQKRG